MRKLVVALSLVIFMAMATSTTAQTSKSLAWQARSIALHGGITGTCHGCATDKMKALMVRVYQERFRESGPAAQRTAICLMQDESGGNPGAISVTEDFGGPQMNKAAHGRTHPSWYQPGRGFSYLIFDPWYGASMMWAMSKGGTDWTQWTGTYGVGMCH